MGKTQEYVDKYNIAKEMYISGALMTDIKREFKMDMQIFRNNLKSEGLFIDRNIDTELKRNAFDIINTEDKAYWLGLLYADGYIDEKANKIELCLKDKEHVEKFKNFLNTRCNVCDKPAMGHIYYRLNVKSKELVSSLVKDGCFQNKSCKITFPTESVVPKHLINAFVRGYFDGNGCMFLSHNKLSISLDSSKDFLDRMKEIYCLKETKYARAGKAYEYRLCAANEVKIFLDKLYKNATIYLDRKYKKYFDNYNN
jgi:hypothetical protein